MNGEVKDILFIDIETAAAVPGMDHLDERLKVLWAKKASFLKREEGITDEELFDQRAGIYAEFGKVVCIAVGIVHDSGNGQPGLRIKSYSGHDERMILSDFSTMLGKLDPQSTKLCAHNGKEFDFPYLCRRLLINNLPLPGLLNLAGRKPWESPHLDTMEMWKFGDYKNYTSLDLLAALFNIPSSKNGMDGSQVSSVYHKEGDLEKIRDYCMRDVVVLTQLYLRLKSQPFINESNITYAP